MLRNCLPFISHLKGKTSLVLFRSIRIAQYPIFQFLFTMIKCSEPLTPAFNSTLDTRLHTLQHLNPPALCLDGRVLFLNSQQPVLWSHVVAEG